MYVSLMRFGCKHYTRKNQHENGQFKPFEDVPPIETGDVPLSFPGV